jgi:hypothetical protein
VPPVRYELGLYVQEDGILHNYRGGNLNFYNQSADNHSINRTIFHKNEIKTGCIHNSDMEHIATPSLPTSRSTGSD